MTTSRYDRLADQRSRPLGRFQWIASDYVLLEETEIDGTYELSVLPADQADCPRAEGALEGDVPLWKRPVATITLGDATGDVVYRADAIERGATAAVRLLTPWGGRGVIIRSGEAVVLKTAGVDLVDDVGGCRVFSCGRWYLGVTGDIVLDGRPERIGNLRGAVVAVGATADEARAEVERLSADEAITSSSAQWNAYLESCPVVDDGDLGDGGDDFLLRQLWHWRAARANIVRSIAHPSVVFVAPDRARWLGSWSSDAPVTIAALALTSERAVAVDVFLRYLRTSLSPEGDLAWYTHPDGVPCLGRLGDTGVMSHGLPEIVWAAEIIDSVYPELADLPGVQGRTVSETLQWYLASGDRRDLNGDGLWETTNLWEGAWDNKVGPMFRDAPIERWVEAMSSRDPRIVGEFLRRYQRPATTLVEQSAYVRAHNALAAMARRHGREELSDWALGRAQHAIDVVRARHWNESTGTYRDWDVTGDCLNDADCLDGFYFLEFETDRRRQDLMVGALVDPERFGMPRLPTLARDDSRYVPDNYWDGSYWPREMAYVAPGLVAAGRADLARDLLVAAISCGEGSEILEHLNADDGSHIRFHRGAATVFNQAMSVGLCLALIRTAKSTHQ